MKALIARFKAWRTRRYWAARHLEFIRTQVLQDLRWLSVDPVGEAIMERYEGITDRLHWYSANHEPIDQFRRRIGMDPHANQRSAISDREVPVGMAGWLTNGAAIHPHTLSLVVRFARALAGKLAAAEVKYGYSDGWLSPGWMDGCRSKLMEHVAKGDPRDVAAYCAFLWHHGEKTALLPSASDVVWRDMATAPKDGTLLRLLVEFEHHATEDGEGPHPTIGSNTWDNHHDFDEWQFAGWSWEQDCYTQGVGKPVGWLPILDAADAAQVAAVAGPTSEHHGLDTDSRVCFYEQDYYVLSNFSSFTLAWRNLRFDTSEAAYHYEKFIGGAACCDAIAHRILMAPSAHEAFKIAEANKEHRRPDWDDVKVGIMRDILRAKAAQHEYVSRKLLATGDRELVENSWRDDFWGWGPKGDGHNMLGRLWMEIRAELRSAFDAKGSTS